MARAIPDGASLIDRREFAGFEVDAKGTDAATFLAIGCGDITNRIEIFFRRMDREEARIARLDGEFRLRQFAGGGVEAGDIDPLAAVLGVRVGAEIDEEIFPGDGGGGEGGKGEGKGGSCHGAPMLTACGAAVKPALRQVHEQNSCG